MTTRTARLTGIYLATHLAIALHASGASADPNPATHCRDAETVLIIWQSQKMIVSRDYTRNPARLVVAGKGWLQLSSETQNAIALAAFCPIARASNGTALEIYDGFGVLLGTVHDNRWYNRLTGE